MSFMKKALLSLLVLIISITAFSQADSIKAPYLKFPTYPPVKILLTDSSTVFTKESLDKKSPVLLMFFDPSCDHCKKETAELVEKMDKLKDVQIVMVSYRPLTDIKTFAEFYGLTKFKNIVMGQDIHFFLPSFYNISFFPFLAFYNKKKELIEVFQGPMPVEKVIETIHK
jgi:thiol-disulfide isomerase/thioredoxin